MDYGSYYQSTVQERQKLSVSYNDTFNVLTAPENQHRFTDKEKASFNYIQNNHRIEAQKRFAVDIVELGAWDRNKPLAFDFQGSPEQIMETPKAVTDFTSAHEIKHASLAYNSKVRGVMNISTLRSGARGFAKGLENISANNPTLNFIMKPLSYGVGLVSYALTRQEERFCDRFALRAYPDANLEEMRAYDEKWEKETEAEKGQLQSETTKPNVIQQAYQNIKEMLEPLGRTHPTNEKRYSSLLKIQQKRM